MCADICPYCDGTGERDFLSGARCYECHGTGWIDFGDDPMSDDEQDQIDRELDLRDAEDSKADQQR